MVASYRRAARQGRSPHHVAAIWHGTPPLHGQEPHHLEFHPVLAHLHWHFNLAPAEGTAARECMMRWDEGERDRCERRIESTMESQHS
ncbi:hypothetical protein MAPG_02089 [Magnaporthiopsis poae ATCC 64411]|uniref:Uncharacterized protein n=1 Tax=Magnaporthiopsis poae (strain ATCC 64411 / 73-15) TaxID=644358 RepID=A0A0C4DQE9_MAGP6|nr:hypothetical protein MAPG_02089 [Magnaporthiopsis poae ATCC 64411]